jgi:HK97 family phage major capsid protein
MPDPQAGQTKEEFLSVCIPETLKDGTAKDNDQAVAICESKWEKKNIDVHDLKVGARHSAADITKIQATHDLTVELGAQCAMPKSDPVTIAEDNTSWIIPGKSIDDAVVFYGSEIKALGDGKLGGYLVRFSTVNDPDLTGDYFTKDTQLGIPDNLPVFYNHGLDTKMGKRLIGKASSKIDDVGAWVETQLNLRDDYEKAIYAMAEAGKLGYSSGALSHLVEREPVKNGVTYIKSWYVGEASLTPTPAEPRNSVMTLKSLVTAPVAAIAAEPILSTHNVTKEGIEMAEPTDKEAMLESAKAAAKEYTHTFVEELKRSMPAEIKAGFNVQVTHDEADTPFSKIGDQLKAIQTATLTQGRELAPRLKALNLKALGVNELIGSEGGFLLEPSFAASLLTPLHDTGAFSSRASRIPIGPNSNGITVRAVDEVTRVAGGRWGGIQGYRLNEAGTKTASNPTFRLVELRLKKYAVLCYATDELLADTTALGGIIQQGASEELDFLVNDDIFEGVGVGGPLGIMNSPALVSVSKEAGQAAGTIVTQNILNMWKRMHPASKGNSVWFINTDCTSQIYQMSLSVGTGGMPMFMMPGSLPNSPAGTLMGRPVIETEFNATCGTTGDIVLADMSQYAMIDREVTAASSIHVQFLTDQTAFRFVYRCDGQPKLASPLTPFHGSNTLSPFVALNTRS